MHAKTPTESKDISYFKIYTFDYYGGYIPHMYLFMVRCLCSAGI